MRMPYASNLINQIRISDQFLGKIWTVLEQVKSMGGKYRIGIQPREPSGIRKDLFHEVLKWPVAATQTNPNKGFEQMRSPLLQSADYICALCGGRAAFEIHPSSPRVNDAVI